METQLQEDVVDFLKLDCEGAEGEILTSVPRPLFRRIRRIALEYHNEVSSLNHTELSDLLRDADYDVSIHWDGYSPYGYLFAVQKNT